MEGNTIKCSLYLKSFKKINCLYMDKEQLSISTVLFKFHLSNELLCFFISKRNGLEWCNPILNTAQSKHSPVASLNQGNLSDIDLSSGMEQETEFLSTIPAETLFRNSATLWDPRQKLFRDATLSPGAGPACTGVGLEKKEIPFHWLTGKADILPGKSTGIQGVPKTKEIILAGCLSKPS